MGSGFSRSLAFIIGINDYQPPVPRLMSARRDARRLAAVLKYLHDYTVSERQTNSAARSGRIVQR